MHVIDLFFTSFNEPMEEDLFSEYLSLLPQEVRERNSRYIRWQDRHANLLGQLLLIEALKKYEIDQDIEEIMIYNSHKRPCLSLKEYDFNISHSGDMVMCGIGKNVRIGVDIEKHRKRNFSDFKNTMTSKQWNEISNTDYSLKTFYKYWTIKESVIKADGRGFYIPLDQLEVYNNTVQVDNTQWFIQDFSLVEGYSTAIATNKLSTVKVHNINFDNSKVV